MVVVPFGSPTIVHDLTVFDHTFHLAAPPQLKVIHPVGKIWDYSPYSTDRGGWALETSLVVEWTHVIALGAKIVVVETPTDEVEGVSGFPDIVKAENYVIQHKMGNVISQSFGATESTFSGQSQIQPLRSAYRAAARAGVMVLANTGDDGASDYLTDASTHSSIPAVNWPSSDPLVTAVGGKTLTLNAQGQRVVPDAVWNDETDKLERAHDSGGGTSQYFRRPSFQSVVASEVGPWRRVPDVSMSAGCLALVDVYESFSVFKGFATPSSGWTTMCGTSEATPLFAGIVALADQEAGHGLGSINPDLYGLLGRPDSGLVDVTSGNNSVRCTDRSGTTESVSGYGARTGYDLASGLGTRDAARFAPALVSEAEALSR